ncbi:MAG TPA: hypothetical protein VFB41_03865 [Solirubrobacteraceae bacterium]|nr:hypothetical protein [Solirubrobacteraceae bacterium]
MVIRVDHAARVAGLTGAALALCAGAAQALPATADTTPPRGSVSGSTGPARGEVTLLVSADDDGAGLASASAYVDGLPLATAALEAQQAARVPLVLDLSRLASGEHSLRVRVADAAGNEAEIYDGTVTVAGPSPIYNPTVVLTIGDPPKPPSQAPVPTPRSGVLAASATSCASPRLSMALDQRPLRVKGGRPVLRAGTRYRYRGRITCLAGKTRRSAPRGTAVELLNRIGKRTWAVTGATTATGGRLTMILAYRSSRTLIFRHRSALGTSQVRLPITIVKAKRR